MGGVPPKPPGAVDRGRADGARRCTRDQLGFEKGSAGKTPRMSPLNTPQNDIRLHLGCGSITPLGWLNTDGSLNARLSRLTPIRRLAGALGIIPSRSATATWSRSVRYLDVRKPLPFPDKSVRYVYASHLLEHLYFNEATSLLLECRRVLRADGLLRVVVPDLETIVREYQGEPGFAGMPDTLKIATRAIRMNLRLLMHNTDAHRNLLYRLCSCCAPVMACMSLAQRPWRSSRRLCVARRNVAATLATVADTIPAAATVLPREAT